MSDDPIKDLITQMNSAMQTLTDAMTKSKTPNLGHLVTVTTVNNQPTKIPAVNLAERKKVIVFNDTGTAIRVGDNTVSITKGVEIKNNESREYVIGPNIQLWAIKASGSGPVVTHEFA